MPGTNVGGAVRLDLTGLDRMLAALTDDGYEVIGPTVDQGAIVHDSVRSVSDLPVGWTDQQEAGHYRLKRRSDRAVFGYVVGPQSWKKHLFPSRLRLWKASKQDGRLEVQTDEDTTPPRYAFIGVRSCEIHAMGIQDKVFTDGSLKDNDYVQRRNGAFIVGVNCTEPGGTCFCVSMNTGPKASSGYDLSITEVLQGEDHYFVVVSGSKRGTDLLARLPSAEATPKENREASHRVEAAASKMGRVLETDGIKEMLYANYDHPQWDDIASRCLSCTNCTMVCPTCFCSTVEDVTDLAGTEAEHLRTWDSCFNLDFSYVQGGSVRSTGRSRYRQWMTHKLATWIDQFGTSGCVGCGRCIAWCPVGIDITEEADAIRNAGPQSQSAGTKRNEVTK
jgi:sulfhydrogenase subunit beta (sulfur reductase)